MMHDVLPFYLALAGWGLAEVRLFLLQRGWQRERVELMNRVQGYGPMQKSKFKSQKNDQEKEGEVVMPPVEVVAARRAFRKLAG